MLVLLKLTECEPMKELLQKAESQGINHIKRHIFICCDATNSKCCKQADGLVSWEYLKNRLKELKLSESGGTTVPKQTV